PAGFMENGESTAEAAVRETLEEACARIEIDTLFSVLSIPHISQVHMLYRGRLIEQSFAPGEESLEVALFAEADIPWDQLAFRTISRTLKLYFEDRRKGRFEIHGGEVIPPP
ncbi:MAG TPA: NUDIX domain-containing protein, partial [Rhodocyclaceae bacterium]|nr:NUDIX domain-containing protein [Rhodocyclaceae bacterium]